MLRPAGNVLEFAPMKLAFLASAESWSGVQLSRAVYSAAGQRGIGSAPSIQLYYASFIRKTSCKRLSRYASLGSIFGVQLCEACQR